jgi:hypothetical protein
MTLLTVSLRMLRSTAGCSLALPTPALTRTGLVLR